jgi:hypothetical protein
MKRKKVHVAAGDSVAKVEVYPTQINGSQTGMKVAGYGFLAMGSVLIFVTLILWIENKSVVDYITSIFMQFLPGFILLISGFKVLKNQKKLDI